MPSARLNLSQFRSAWWRRPSMFGVVGGALAIATLGASAWVRISPLDRLPEPATPSPIALPPMRTFDRASPDARALAAISQNNVLAESRSDFVRDVAIAQDTPAEDPNANDRAKRRDAAISALRTLRLVAILRLQDEWIALFEPSSRKAEDDLLSLRVGDTWQGWTIGSITRDEVRLGFEGHEERVELKPGAGRPIAKNAPPRGRIEVQSSPVTKGREIRVDPAISRSEARERLLGATREESERVRKLAEDLLKDLERENE